MKYSYQYRTNDGVIFAEVEFSKATPSNVDLPKDVKQFFTEEALPSGTKIVQGTEVILEETGKVIWEI